METVLVTGCSSGIGAATARTFLQNDWRVYATARDPADVEALAGAGCARAALDVTDDEAARAVVDRVVEEEGRIDCLVNNAGYGQLGAIEDVPADRVHAQFDVNVYGPHRLTRAALPHMREQGAGTIVNVSSVAGRVATPGMGVYAGSKFALEAMSDALRAEVPEGIDVVVIEPGPVDTPFRDRAEAELDGIERSEAYGSIYDAYEDVHTVGAGSPASVSPDAVAGVILDAATDPDPDPRYQVGTLARVAVLARFLPDRWRDGLFRLAGRVL